MSVDFSRERARRVLLNSAQAKPFFSLHYELRTVGANQLVKYPTCSQFRKMCLDYVAIEMRMRFKMPADKFHRQKPSRDVRYLRLISDIADCELSKAPLIAHNKLEPLLHAMHQGSFERLICEPETAAVNPRDRLVACSKHLCGVATGVLVSFDATFHRLVRFGNQFCRATEDNKSRTSRI